MLLEPASPPAAEKRPKPINHLMNCLEIGMGSFHLQEIPL